MRPIFPAVLLAFLFHGLALAEEAPVDEHAAEMARAGKLHDEAKALREATEARYLDEQIACYKRFLVNRCLDQSRLRHIAEVRKARELEQEAKRLELAAKNRRYAERKAEQAETAPAKAVERAEQEARNRADTEERLKKLSEKDAERIRTEQEAKTRALLDAEERNRREAAEAQRRADEATAAAHRAEVYRTDRQDYEERAKKAAEKKAEKEKKKAAQ